MWRVFSFFIVAVGGMFFTASCSSPDINPSVTVSSVPFHSGRCSGTFVAHDLAHITQPTSRPIEMFDSNGSGLAINDLDGDGDLDLVLANLDGPNTLLWNEGDLNFRTEPLGIGQSRGVTAVDVDGDGWVDLTFSTNLGLVHWKNRAGSFEQSNLDGVRKPAYAFTWHDIDRDGDLDLITGSYDAALSRALGDGFLNNDAGSGVYLYENENGRFTPTRLADEAQALAIITHDFNRDGQQDILVGNDFVVQDQLWLQTASGWEESHLFQSTTHSTMSFAIADVNNDGRSDLLATDMHPASDDPAVLAAWEPVMAMMMHGESADDPQVMENVLQISTGRERFSNAAFNRGLAYSGWSWSAKFGDLNHDGWLDAYIVNGMIAAELFGHLPQNELVEKNQAYQNLGGGMFQPVTQWGLGSIRSGRGMSMADLDQDGDLDIVVNNLDAPAQLFENQLCSENSHSVEIQLEWPGSQNTQGLGGFVQLITADRTITQEIRANSGYLSGDPPVIHFGWSNPVAPQKIKVIWPDGAQSEIEAIQADHLYIIKRH
ncbi:MAG: CRTAC1 family protein [Ardenticatenaceae bacterium]|nr:CRTAC1 family protein [Ardenticatenaceae bacterium]